MLDDALVDAFAHGFFGYGDYRARYWFVGMEEGGGGTEAEIGRRLAAWHARGRRELEDLAEFHAAIGEVRWFKRAILQPTWRGLIRIVMAAEGLASDKEDVRAYQRDRLGRPGGETCLIEIMPLPSPRSDVWHYATMLTDARFRSRQAYVDALRAERLGRIQTRIDEWRPPFVIIYGTSRAAFAPPAGTRVVQIKHPTAHGVTILSLAEIGRSLRDTAE
jgi:hypothetical protein